MKKILAVFGIALVLLGASYYYFIWRQKPISTQDQTNNNPTDLFPAGTPKTPDNQQTATSSLDQSNNQSSADFGLLTTSGNLVQLTSQPIAGANASINSSTTIYFADKSTGHIFKITNLNQNPQKITNTTFTKTYSYLWGENSLNLNVLFSHVDQNDQFKFFSGSIKNTPSSTTEAVGLNGRYLNEKVIDISASPDKKRLFVLEEGGDGSIGYISNFDLTQKNQIFKSPAKEWRAAWVNSNTIALQTKAATKVPGYLYFLNPTNRSTTKIISGLAGLTTLVSPNNQQVLYATAPSFGSLVTSLFNVANQKTINLSIRTLPEKCVWAKDNIVIYCGVPTSLVAENYPDSWYDGGVLFNDAIWQINTNTGSTTKLFDPLAADTKEPIDVYQPFISGDGKNLVFTNKQNLTLWALKLGQ